MGANPTPDRDEPTDYDRTVCPNDGETLVPKDTSTTPFLCKCPSCGYEGVVVPDRDDWPEVVREAAEKVEAELLDPERHGVEITTDYNTYREQFEVSVAFDGHPAERTTICNAVLDVLPGFRFDHVSTNAVVAYYVPEKGEVGA